MTMTRFKAQLRDMYLSLAGRLTLPSSGVHILAGHVLNRSDEGRSADVFLNQLKMLSEFCEFIDFRDAVSLIRSGMKSTEKSLVAFTFDDGFSDCYESIAPALNEFGVKAAFFINPNFCLGSEAYIRNFSSKAVLMPGKEPMTSEQVKDLARQGHTIGAHTLDHALLATSDEEVLYDQIVKCKKSVEDISNEACIDFAWTYGGYKHISQKGIDMARRTYENVFSSDNYRFYLGDGEKNIDVINRRHFEPYWSPYHVKYFLSKTKHY